ncbi:hypothetical protein F5Y18DRAFT_368935 [Xylariaceae sp. FL1019]|nr:hypothetical protein F5Y18DRAFT_368935 [Xylariaceae sp. FL1019]
MEFNSFHNFHIGRETQRIDHRTAHSTNLYSYPEQEESLEGSGFEESYDESHYFKLNQSTSDVDESSREDSSSEEFDSEDQDEAGSRRAPYRQITRDRLERRSDDSHQPSARSRYQHHSSSRGHSNSQSSAAATHRVQRREHPSARSRDLVTYGTPSDSSRNHSLRQTTQHPRSDGRSHNTAIQRFQDVPAPPRYDNSLMLHQPSALRTQNLAMRPSNRRDTGRERVSISRSKSYDLITREVLADLETKFSKIQRPLLDIALGGLWTKYKVKNNDQCSTWTLVPCRWYPRDDTARDLAPFFDRQARYGINFVVEGHADKERIIEGALPAIIVPLPKECDKTHQTELDVISKDIAQRLERKDQIWAMIFVFRERRGRRESVFCPPNELWNHCNLINSEYNKNIEWGLVLNRLQTYQAEYAPNEEDNKERQRLGRRFDRSLGGNMQRF